MYRELRKIMKKLFFLIATIIVYGSIQSQISQFYVGNFNLVSENGLEKCYSLSETPIDIDFPVCTQVDVPGTKTTTTCGGSSTVTCYSSSATCYSYFKDCPAGIEPSENDPLRLIFLVKNNNEITKTDNLVYTRRVDRDEFKLFNAIDMSSNGVAQALFNPGNSDPQVNGPVTYLGEFSRIVNPISGGNCHIISCSSDKSVKCYEVAIMFKQKYDELFQ